MWVLFGVGVASLCACGGTSFSVTVADADPQGDADPLGHTPGLDSGGAREGGAERAGDSGPRERPQDASGPSDGGLPHPDAKDAPEPNVDAAIGIFDAHPRPPQDAGGPGETCATYRGACAAVGGVACGSCPPSAPGYAPTTCGDDGTPACGNACLSANNPYNGGDYAGYVRACSQQFPVYVAWVTPGDCVGVPWTINDAGEDIFRPSGRQGCLPAPYDSGYPEDVKPAGALCCPP